MVTSKIGQNDDLSAGPVLFHAAVRLDDLVDQKGLAEAELNADSGAAPQLLALCGVPDGRPATRCSAPIRVASL
jgi:hypothetical protein